MKRCKSYLQNLPSEKLDNILQIIKKRNSSLCQYDDQIGVDIDRKFFGNSIGLS